MYRDDLENLFFIYKRRDDAVCRAAAVVRDFSGKKSVVSNGSADRRDDKK